MEQRDTFSKKKLIVKTAVMYGIGDFKKGWIEQVQNCCGMLYVVSKMKECSLGTWIFPRIN